MGRGGHIVSRKKTNSQRVQPALAKGGSSTRPAARIHPVLIIVAVLGLVVIAHWPGLHAGALSFDDGEYLTHNVLVRNPSLHNAGRFLGEILEPSTVHGYYQPLTMISLMADYALGGRPDHLLPFHRTSLVLHVANTLLVMLVLYALFENIVAASLAGLLFGVHPMTVETIVWVGERKTVLAAFFAFASVLAYVRYAKKQEQSRWGCYAASVVAFALGLLSKPTITPLPVCLLLLDFWPLHRLNRRAILEKVPFFIIALISAYITVESQRRTAVAVMPGQEGSIAIPYVVCHNVVFYLRNMLVPIHLSSHYAFPAPLSMKSPAVAVGVIGTAVLLGFLIVSLRRTRAFATGWLFFILAIFPTLGVIGFTNVIAADKYAYWPALGVLLVLAWGMKSLWEPRKADSAAGAWVVAGALLAAGMFGLGTRAYLQRWSTTESLFRYMVSLDNAAAAPLIYLGLELDDQGRTAEALPLHREAARLAPAFEGSHYNLGNSLQKLGRYDEAIVAYRNAIRAKPEFADAFNNMGNALLAKQDVANAKAAYQQAIALKPNLADAHYNLANVLRGEGDISGAVEQYQTTIRLQNDHSAAHKNLAGVLWLRGEFAAALQHYEQVLRLQPGDWQVALRMADFLTDGPAPGLRRPERAVEFARQAVTATGRQNAAALAALALALDRAGRTDEAADPARQAMALAVSRGEQGLASRIQELLGRYLASPSSQKSTYGQ